jgi:HEAT repeat protein
MFTPFTRGVLALAAVSSLCGAAAAQTPAVTNGRVASQPAGSPFPRAFGSLVSAQTETAWIAYGVPVVDRDRSVCCNGSDADGSFSTRDNGMWGPCRLEAENNVSALRTTAAASGPRGPVQLEGADRIFVLFRVVERKVERIRVVSGDCALDAGGRPFHWLEGVRPADSVALLEAMVTDADSAKRLSDGAVTGIALHGDASADASLERLVTGTHAESIRRKVTFWLGNARGRRGLDALRKVMRDDPSVEVRKSAVFGVSQSKVPDAVDTLLSIARTDPEPRLRSEGLFWLAQKAGRKAAAAITDSIEQDPDTDVKKKAVFALSQLPHEEGVPLLINVARTNTNPAVRKQAMFWLGQSKDPRAVEFFAQVLK